MANTKTERSEENGEVAAVITGKLAKNENRPIDKLKEHLLNRAELDGVNLAYDVAASQVDKIATAESIDEIFEADNLDQIAGRDLVDVEQRIEYYTVHKSTRSDITSHLGVFLMVHATRLDNGEELIWDTSAPLLVAKLAAFERIGAFPVEVVIKATAATNGDVLKFRPVPKRVVQS